VRKIGNPLARIPDRAKIPKGVRFAAASLRPNSVCVRLENEREDGVEDEKDADQDADQEPADCAGLAADVDSVHAYVVPVAADL
jgi:hypothetical protein